MKTILTAIPGAPHYGYTFVAPDGSRFGFYQLFATGMRPDRTRFDFAKQFGVRFIPGEGLNATAEVDNYAGLKAAIAGMNWSGGKLHGVEDNTQ